MSLPSDLEQLVREHTMSCEQIWIDYFGRAIVDKMRTAPMNQINFNDMHVNGHHFGLHGEVLALHGNDIATIRIWCGSNPPLQITIGVTAAGSDDDYLQDISPALATIYAHLMKMRECQTCERLTAHHSRHCGKCISHIYKEPCPICGQHFGKMVGGIHQKCDATAAAELTFED